MDILISYLEYGTALLVLTCLNLFVLGPGILWIGDTEFGERKGRWAGYSKAVSRWFRINMKVIFTILAIWMIAWLILWASAVVCNGC